MEVLHNEREKADFQANGGEGTGEGTGEWSDHVSIRYWPMIELFQVLFDTQKLTKRDNIRLFQKGLSVPKEIGDQRGSIRHTTKHK